MSSNLRTLLISAFLLTAPVFAAKKVIMPPEFAPKAGAPAPNYSPGILVDGTLYIAGQVGQDIKTNEIPKDFEAEVKTCLERIGVILKAAGMSFDDIVAVQVYLTDMDQFAKMNSVYASMIKSPRPARTTVGVTKLAAANAHIEITVTAHK